jgi:O-antigen ligase
MIIDSPFLNMHFRTTHTSSVFFNRNHTGYYFCIATILNSIEILRLKLKTKKDIFLLILRLIVFGICFYGNILTNSTGSFLGIIFGGCCLIFATALFNKDILKHAIFIFSTIIIVTIISVFTGKSPLLDVLRVFIDFGIILKDTRSEEALRAGTTRWRLWLGAIQLIKEKPWFGFGPDCLEPEYLRIGINDGRPHCEPLQFAAELGVPASIAYLISIITFTVTFLSPFGERPLLI